MRAPITAVAPSATQRHTISRPSPVLLKYYIVSALAATLCFLPATLVRFYVLHVAVIPAAMVFLIAIHMWRWRKDSMLTMDPPAEEQTAPDDGELAEVGEGA